jgi:hypothetical protein
MEQPSDFIPVRIQSSVMRRNKRSDCLSILGRQIGKRYLSGRLQ